MTGIDNPFEFGGLQFALSSICVIYYVFAPSASPENAGDGPTQSGEADIINRTLTEPHHLSLKKWSNEYLYRDLEGNALWNVVELLLHDAFERSCALVHLNIGTVNK